LDDYVPVATKGQPNGVAELDNSGKIPSSQIPELVGLDTEITSAVNTAVANLVDGAPAALNTLNEIATVIGDSNNITGSLITNIGGLNDSIALHVSSTKNVHGIGDTANLATKTEAMGYANSAETNAISTSNTYTDSQVTLSATNTLASAGTAADDKITTHNLDTTNVHGIADTGALATMTYVDDAVSTSAATTLSTASDAASTALVTHSADTTSVHGISDTANLVYTSDSRLSDERTPSAGSVTAAKIASDAVETAKIKDLNVTTAKIADSAITSAKIADGTIVDGDISSSAAISQSKISGLSTSLSAKLDSSTAASTYAPIASPTFTGTVAGITKSMVGLGNVDNTSDANKPVSTATQTALDAKASLSGATFTGAVSGTSLTLSGNLTVNGTTTTVNTTNFTTSDPVIYLADGNNANTVDLGFVASYNDGTYAHQGLVKDTSDSKWKLFKGVTDEPTTTVNFAQGSLDTLAVGALEASSATIGNVSNTELQYLDGVTSAIQTQIDAKAPKASPTFTGAVTVSSSGVVFTDGTQTKAGVPSITEFATAISSSATLASGQQDKFVPLTGAVTITLPSTGYSAGQSIDFYQESGTGAQFASTNGVVGTPGLKFRTTYSVVTAMKTSTGWLVFGDLSA
jgi:hypothetical protein